MYQHLLDKDDEVQVTEGFCEDDETTVTMLAHEALAQANDFNEQRYHPDVYVVIKQGNTELQQVVQDHHIIGFMHPWHQTDRS